MSNLWKVVPLLVLFASSATFAAEEPSGQPAAAPDTAPAASADAPPPPVAEKKAQEIPDSVAMLTGQAMSGDRKSPFGGTIILDTSLGLGTFVADTYARNPYVGMSLSLRPRYYFLKNLFLDLRFDLNVELTTSYQTSTTYKRQVMPSDLFLTLKYQNVVKIPVVDIGFSPFLRLGAPTSYESRFRDLYLSAALGFDLTRMFGQHVYLAYQFRANKNFHGTKYARINGETAVARLKGNEDLGGGYVAGDARNVEWSVYNSLTGSFIINDQWSITLQLAIQNSFTYDSPAMNEDTYQSEFAKAGRGQGDKTIGVIDVTYQPWENVGFSLGLSSQQPAKTADNKSFRFPFFDFVSTGNNYTNLYFDIYATF